MTPVFPFYTAIYTGILGLLAALLTVNVIVNRVRAKVDIADGGVAALGQAIRAHGNFAEHTPLALLLIGFVEAFGYRSAVIQRVGCGAVSGPAAQRLGPQFVAEADFRPTVGRRADDPDDRHCGGADTLRGKRRALMTCSAATPAAQPAAC